MSEPKPKYYTEWGQYKDQVKEKTDGRCWYCGIYTQPFDEEKFREESEDHHYRIPSDTFVIDHFVPLSFGGKNDIHNLVPCCWACNNAKKNKTLEEFRFLRSRQLAGMPNFNEDQISYLLLHGISLPPIQTYQFYFERTGLKP